MDWEEILGRLQGLPQPTYVVGGAVRDRLLGRQKVPLDLDLVVPSEGLRWGSCLAREWQGGFVALDRQRQIARVVLPDLTVDIATLVGGSLEADLRQRDFTCNALALEIHDGELRDPLGGAADIAQGVLRMVHPENFTEDPLRVLRGYRHMAQLGFQLDPQTRLAMQARANLLARVAGERVRGELLGLLAEPGLAALQEAVQDGILEAWLPPLGHWDWARRSQTSQLGIPEVEVALADVRPVKWVLTLLILLADLGIPDLDDILRRLHFSRLERQWCQKIAAALPLWQRFWQQQTVTNLDRHTLFASVGKAFPGLVWVAQGHPHCPPDFPWQEWLNQFRDPEDPLAHLVPLLTGQDVMEVLQIPSSPEVGKVLHGVIQAQVSGTLHSRSEAIAWLKTLKGREGTEHLAKSE